MHLILRRTTPEGAMQRYEYRIEGRPCAGACIVRSADANAVERDHALGGDLAAAWSEGWFRAGPGNVETRRAHLVDLYRASTAAPSVVASAIPTDRLVEEVRRRMRREQLLVVPPGLGGAQSAAGALVDKVRAPWCEVPAAPLQDGGEHDPAWSRFDVPIGRRRHYLEQIRAFFKRFFRLDDCEATALRIVPTKIVGGNLDFKVDGFDWAVGPRPTGPQSLLQKHGGGWVNFYENVGPGEVAHVTVQMTPWDGGLAVYHGEVLIHFDMGNPRDVAGIFKHLFGDVIWGHIWQLGHRRVPRP
jgi:hypothetical protein